jgi:hypothetical protein
MGHATEYEELIDDIVGSHLKCSKGNWTLDDSPIETGPDGFRLTIFAPTAQHGRIKWVDGHPRGKVLQKYSDGLPTYEEMPEGWNGYTVFQGISNSGELLTFTSALGVRKTLKNVIQQFRFRGKRAFPTCTLGTKPRGDAHNNVDPVFTILNWVDVSTFSEFFPEIAERSQLAAPSAQLPPPPKTIDDLLAADSHSEPGKPRVEPPIDDEIPF